MAKKELRTVKKSNQTGRLNRAAVRAAVIAVRDARLAKLRSQPEAPVRRAGTRNRAHAECVPVAAL